MFSIARAVPALLAALGAASFSGLIAAQPPATAKPPAPPAPAAAQPAAREGLVPASARRSDEGLGPFKTLVIRGVMVIDGTGAPPYGPMNVVVAGNRILRFTAPARRGWRCSAKRAPQNADHEIDAHRDVSDARLRRHARARRRPAEERRGRVRLQALARARRDDGARRLAGRQRLQRQREGAQREERDRRAAHLQLPASRERLGQGRHHAPDGRASGCAGAPPTASTA